MLIIGSRALKYHLDLDIKCGDWDFIMSPQEFVEFKEKNSRFFEIDEPLSVNKHHFLILRAIHKFAGHIEIDIAWTGSLDAELIQIVEENGLHKDGYVTPEVCLALKLTHRYLRNSPHFIKTMRDIQAIRAMGYSVPECLKDWCKRREEETLNHKHPNLNQSKKDFFDTPGVTYKYDHDSLHLAVARFKTPCYNYFKPDESEVLCSKEFFNQCDEDVKLGSVVEESIVLALERCLIPNAFKHNHRGVFLYALQKVCTSIASGWWREYAWENYDNAIELFDKHYSGFVDKFIDGVYDGVIVKSKE